MKKKMLLIVILCLLSTNVALASRQAACIVAIQMDPQILTLDFETLNQILYSPAVAADAVKKVLKSDLESDSVLEIIEFLGKHEADNSNKYVCDIRIDLTNTNKKLPAVAEELLKAVTESLRNTMYKAYTDFLASRDGGLKTLEVNIRKARDDWANRNADYANFIKNKTIPHSNIPRYISDLTEKVEAERLEMDINRRMLEELKAHRVEVKHELRKQIDGDSIVTHLSKLVEMAAGEVKELQDHKKKNPENFPDEVFRESEKNLLKAKIELAKRQEQIRQQTQSELADISKQIADRSMENPAMEMRYRFLYQKMEKARESLVYSHEYETLELERAYAKKNLEKAMKIYQDAKLDNARFSPPTVIAIGVK
jgi:hypothetical protein